MHRDRSVHRPVGVGEHCHRPRARPRHRLADLRGGGLLHDRHEVVVPRRRRPTGATAWSRRLRLMHHYHHVHVNVLVGYTPRHAYSSVQKDVLLRARGHLPLRLPEPRAAAPSPTPSGSPSPAAQHRCTAVLSTSTNWSHGQFTLSESGLLVVGDRSLYNAFVGDWSTLSRCVYRRCTTAAHERYVAGLRGRPGHVLPGRPPATRSPTSWPGPAAVAAVRFALSSLFLNRPAVVGQLEQARARGCVVRVRARRTAGRRGRAGH